MLRREIEGGKFCKDFWMRKLINSINKQREKAFEKIW